MLKLNWSQLAFVWQLLHHKHELKLFSTTECQFFLHPIVLVLNCVNIRILLQYTENIFYCLYKFRATSQECVVINRC